MSCAIDISSNVLHVPKQSPVFHKVMDGMNVAMQILMKCAMLQLHRPSGQPYNCIGESPGSNSDRAIGYSK